MKDQHPLDRATAVVLGWAYTDSLVRLKRTKVREALAADLAENGLEVPNEDELADFVCNADDDPTVVCMRATFPKLDAYLNEELG